MASAAGRNRTVTGLLFRVGDTARSDNFIERVLSNPLLDDLPEGGPLNRVIDNLRNPFDESEGFLADVLRAQDSVREVSQNPFESVAGAGKQADTHRRLG